MSAPPTGRQASVRLITSAEKQGTRTFSISKTQGVLFRLLRLICRPSKRLELDSFSDRMLRDIGIDPTERRGSSIGFWRRR